MTTQKESHPPKRWSPWPSVPIQAAALGLAVSQAVAFAHVRFSNLAYHDKLAAIREAGYLTVPNARTAESLLRLKTAAYGGLFFTLTVGLGLTLISAFAAWFWIRPLRRDRTIGVLLALTWVVMLFNTNANGVSLFASAYPLIVPPIVFGFLHWRLPPSDRTAFDQLRPVGIHLAAIAAFVAVFYPMLNVENFSHIRDRFLLGNRVGLAVNDFYYAYTLYPAQAFRSLHQEQMRTAFIDIEADAPNLESRLAEALRRLKYLPMPSSAAADVVITGDEDRLRLSTGDAAVLEIPADDFFEKPGDTLRAFSDRTDRYGGLRRTTLHTLLLNLLLVPYGLVFMLFRGGTGRFLDEIPATLVGAGGALLAGLLLTLSFNMLSPAAVDEENLGEALRSEDSARRIAAMKLVQEKRLALTDLVAIETVARSAPSLSIPERLMLTRALAHDRSDAAYDALVRLLDDPQLNVRYMAARSLAQQGQRRAVAKIRSRLAASDQWYFQMYALNALRRLGWRQTASR